VLFAAVIIGGSGSHRGAVIGAILVPVGFEEASRYLPPFGPPGTVEDLQWVAIGLLILVFLWFRPQGVLPERRRMIGAGPPPVLAVEGPNDDVVTVSAWPWGPGVAGDGDGSAVGPAAPARLAAHGAAAVGAAAASTGASAVPAPGRADGAVVLRAVDLVKDFGGVHAVAGVSVEVRRGTLTGLIGPNGAGKSTLLGMLAGTIAVTSGQVIYEGTDVTGLPAYRRARLGLVRTFQLASEFKRLTVMENLLSAAPGNRGDTLVGALRGRRYWRRDEAAAIDRARALLDRFGLSSLADTYGGDLSGGQRRLTEIMRALMTEPTMLLLDEPMAGVHPRLARQIGGHLLELCAEGMTILMVEHELAIMDEFCDPVIMMAEGVVLASGTMADLRARADVVEAYLVG